MSDANKRYVVTGGAGFIGSHIVDALIAAGHKVDVIDNLVEGKRENVNPSAELHVADICDYDAIAPIIEGADGVFHLAALPRVQFSIDEPLVANSVNVDGTLSVLTAAMRGKAGKVVFASSAAIYGDEEVMPLSEDMPARPLSPYALHKYAGEHYCKLFSKLYGLPTACLRFFNVYGPRFDPNGPYALVVGRFLKLRKEGQTITITGDGEQTRDFVHVHDIARANILAMQNDQVKSGEVMNIGTGKEITVNRLAELIGGPTEYVAPRIEPRRALADNRRAKDLLGWEPIVVLEDGIAELKREFGI
jgi:nucleoside-diphosphate-sugar epimerase